MDSNQRLLPCEGNTLPLSYAPKCRAMHKGKCKDWQEAFLSVREFRNNGNNRGDQTKKGIAGTVV